MAPTHDDSAGSAGLAFRSVRLDETTHPSPFLPTLYPTAHTNLRVSDVRLRAEGLGYAVTVSGFEVSGCKRFAWYLSARRVHRYKNRQKICWGGPVQ